MFEPREHSGADAPQILKVTPERVAQLHSAAVLYFAIRMLVALELVDDAQKLDTMKKLLVTNELGLKITPMIHDRSRFKWTIVTSTEEFVLELGEGPLP